MIVPPVGKSGPGMIFMIASSRICGLSMSAMTASATSFRLCGGIEVAMPTAIPCEPLQRRFGNFAGRTVGSTVDSS